MAKIGLMGLWRAPVKALRLVGIVLGLCAEVSALGGCATMAEVGSMLPREIHGWARQGEDAFYDGETLFDYLDGGAEVYRSFGVRRVVARRYVKSGEPEIIADIFEMGSPADAYGVYHHDLRTEGEAGVGNESEYLEGALQFWKGRFFVSVLTLEETDASARAVLDLGKAIASAIEETGSPPDLLSFLPGKDRLAGHVRYFHDHACLNSYYFLADKDLLNLHPGTEGILARFRSDPPGVGEGVVLILVRYPSRQEAMAAQGRFFAEYLPEADVEGIARVEGGKWVGLRSEGELLAVVLDAGSRAEAKKALASVFTRGRGGGER